MKKIRLDQLVFDLGLTESRERAKTTVMSGLVFVNGQRADKPGMQVSPDANVEVKGAALPYVSRGGFKLEKALKVFPVDPEDKVCIDCGASTGGFTDVLLQNGAKKVYSVDVGYGQLAWSLRTNDKVINMERTNIRYVTHEDIGCSLDFASVDVSFISLKLIFPVMAKLMKSGGECVCLIKPQFEAGKESVGKNGVVRDKETHKNVINSVLSYAAENGFGVLGLDFSPIKGPKGNIEYLLYGKLQGDNAEIDIDSVVNAAHELAH